MTAGAPTIAEFFEAWAIFRDPALTGLLAGAMLGVLGVYVVLRRMVFLAATVSQAASFGVASSYLFGFGGLGLAASIAPTVGALAMTFLTLWIVAADRSHEQHRRDSLLGFVFLVASAGTLAVGTRIVEEIQDIESVLFGTAVAVLPADFWMVLIISVGVLGAQLWGWRGFSAVSFDRTGALVRDLPVRALELGLFIGLGFALAVCTRVLGALPTFAFSVLPALAATRVAPNVRASLLIAGVIGGVSGFGGYLIAFLFELPVGASQTLLAAVAVAATLPMGRHHHH